MIRIELLLFLVLFFAGCKNTFQPKTGDLLFQDIDCGPLCDAIEQVTQGYQGAKFSHVGIAIVENKEVQVLEAVSAGVKLTPLEEFLERSTDSLGQPKVIVGRVGQVSGKELEQLKDNMGKYLHQPYDDIYDLNNDAYYCSELVHFLFHDITGEDLFELKPMTFKLPDSNTFFPEWSNYFEVLGQPVPEGKPGLNPGSISRSSNIKIIHVYGKPDGFKQKEETP